MQNWREESFDLLAPLSGHRSLNGPPCFVIDGELKGKGRADIFQFLHQQLNIPFEIFSSPEELKNLSAIRVKIVFCLDKNKAEFKELFPYSEFIKLKPQESHSTSSIEVLLQEVKGAIAQPGQICLIGQSQSSLENMKLTLGENIPSSLFKKQFHSGKEKIIFCDDFSEFPKENLSLVIFLDSPAHPKQAHKRNNLLSFSKNSIFWKERQ